MLRVGRCRGGVDHFTQPRATVANKCIFTFATIERMQIEDIADGIPLVRHWLDGPSRDRALKRRPRRAHARRRRASRKKKRSPSRQG